MRIRRKLPGFPGSFLSKRSCGGERNMAEEKKKKGAGRIPVTLLFFRGLIGCYLVWLGWGLRKTALSGKEGSLPMLAAMILFIAVGGALAVFSLIKYQRREFLLPGSEDLTDEEITDEAEGSAASEANAPEENAPDADKG